MTAAHRYQILAPLARGGMGEILLARRLGPAGFEKLVVLKRPLHAAGSRALVTALIDEARLLARINHPNVCQVYDLEQAGDQFFFAMEYLEGLSMWSMLGEVPGGTAPGILCGLFEQACDGLEAIHAMRTADGGRVVHRDVSPGNLFVTERGIVKVLDLGIAKSSDSEERTPFGRIKGKLGYLSPEQAAGASIDHRSDLFSLGLVLHDMIRARRPMPDRIGAIAAATLDLDAVPPPLAGVIRRAVAEDPADRFASARAMAAALRDAGAALGGSQGPRELAAWLAVQFGPELARRRAIAAGPSDATRTQIWSLRSASAGTSEDDETASAGAVDPPAPRVHETERLALPTRERLAPRRGAVPTGRPATRRPGAVIAGVAAAAAIAIGAWAAVRAPDSAARAASPAVASPANAATANAAAAIDPPAATSSASNPTPTAAAPPAAAPAAGSADPPSHAAAAAPATATTTSPATPAPRHRPRRSSEPVATGLLTIDSQPFAVIRLGDRELGTTPLWRIPLPAGRYELRAATADGRYQDVAFRIAPGHERKVMLDWSRF